MDGKALSGMGVSVILVRSCVCVVVRTVCVRGFGVGVSLLMVGVECVVGFFGTTKGKRICFTVGRELSFLAVFVV